MEEKLHTPADAAGILGYSRSWIYAEWAEGRGPDWILVGKRRRVTPQALREYIASCQHFEPSAPNHVGRDKRDFRPIGEPRIQAPATKTVSAAVLQAFPGGGGPSLRPLVKRQPTPQLTHSSARASGATTLSEKER
jgi:hypothetical protein